MSTYPHARTSLRRSGLLGRGAALVLMMIAGCQEPTEPENVVVGSGFPAAVAVKDQAGNPVAGAQVSWSLKRDSGLGRENRMTEEGAGVHTDVIPVPVSDSNALVLFRTVPPRDPDFEGEQKNGAHRLDTARVCGSTAMTVVLQRSRRLTGCGGTLACDDILLSVAPPARTSATGCSKIYMNATGEQITVAPPVVTPPNPDIRAYISVGPFPDLPGPVTVDPGQKFQVCFVLQAAPSAPASLTEHTVSIDASTPGDPTCFSCTFELKAEVAPSSNCDCPTFPAVSFPAAGKEAVVCVGNSSDVSIPLGSIRNPNDDPNCVLIFERGTQSIDPDITLLSLNGGPTADRAELPKGGSLGSLDLRFTPRSARAYTQTILYRVRLRNLATGDVRDCPNGLRITFNGRAGTAACEIDYPASTLIKTPPRLTDTLFQGPDQDVAPAKTICIRNSGTGCDLVIDRATISGDRVFQIDASRLPISIPPGKSECLAVKFLPTTDDVWPNGRANPARLIFKGTLRIGTDPACAEQTFDLTGVVQPQPYNASCFLQWSAASGGYKGGMFFSDKGELSFPLRDDKNQLAVYAESIDLTATPPTAVLASGGVAGAFYTYFEKQPAKLFLGNRDICEFTANYQARCPDRSSTVAPGGFQSQATVEVGDVLVISYWNNGRTYCAVMVITDIRLDKDPVVGSGKPQVCFQVCFPL